MKKNVILLLILTTVLTTKSQELKGFKLGQRTAKDELFSTIGNIKGMLFLTKLNDGRINQILFIALDNDRKPIPVPKADVKNVLEKLKKKFGVKLEEKEGFGTDVLMTGTRGDFEVFVFLENYTKNISTCGFCFSIKSISLNKTFEFEQLLKSKINYAF